MNPIIEYMDYRSWKCHIKHLTFGYSLCTYFLTWYIDVKKSIRRDGVCVPKYLTMPIYNFWDEKIFAIFKRLTRQFELWIHSWNHFTKRWKVAHCYWIAWFHQHVHHTFLSLQVLRWNRGPCHVSLTKALLNRLCFPSADNRGTWIGRVAF